ncbi:MAG: hypothetical protein WB996_01575 [Ignavibacteriaceae bacterium]
MKRLGLTIFVLALIVGFSGNVFAQQKEKKEDAKTTKVDVKKQDPDFNKVVSIKEGTPVNSVCPVSGEELDEDQQLIKYKGEVMAVCCKKCLKKIKADPEKYMKRLKRDYDKDK